MLRIGIIVGSTRPNRIGLGVAKWVSEIAAQREDAQFELVDIASYHLPLLDEPMPPALGHYRHEHTKVWSQKISSLDGFIFVSPEYNHGISGALKNALDFLYAEWNNKACGFVAYGNMGGARAVEQLRMVCGELQMATVRNQLGFILRTDFENYTTLKPQPYHTKALHALMDQVVAWSGALKTMREQEGVIPSLDHQSPTGTEAHH